MNIPRGAPANYWNPTEIVFNGNMIIKSDNQAILNGHTNCQDQGLRGEKMESNEDDASRFLEN